MVGKSRSVRQIGFSQAGAGAIRSEDFNSNFGLRDFSKSYVLEVRFSVGFDLPRASHTALTPMRNTPVRSRLDGGLLNIFATPFVDTHFRWTHNATLAQLQNKS